MPNTFPIRQRFEPTDPDSIANAFEIDRRNRRYSFDRVLLALGGSVLVAAILLGVIFAVLAMLAPLAHADTGDSATQGDAVGWLRTAYDAIAHGGPGGYKLLAGAVLSLIVYALRTYSETPVPVLGFKIPLPSWFLTRRGGAVLVFILAVGSGLGHALLAGAPLNLLTFESAAIVGIAAIGGYEGLRSLFGNQEPRPPAKVAGTLPLR